MRIQAWHLDRESENRLPFNRNGPLDMVFYKLLVKNPLLLYARIQEPENYRWRKKNLCYRSLQP